MILSDNQIRTMLLKIEYEIARQKMTKKTFYEKSGVSSSLYSQWNTGSARPTMKSVGRVADALGLSVEFLIGETGKEKETVPEDDLSEELQILREDPETRALLRSSRGLTKEQLRAVSEMLRQMRRTNSDDY